MSFGRTMGLEVDSEEEAQLIERHEPKRLEMGGA